MLSPRGPMLSCQSRDRDCHSRDEEPTVKKGFVLPVEKGLAQAAEGRARSPDSGRDLCATRVRPPPRGRQQPLISCTKGNKKKKFLLFFFFFLFPFWPFACFICLFSRRFPSSFIMCRVPQLSSLLRLVPHGPKRKQSARLPCHVSMKATTNRRPGVTDGRAPLCH